MAKRKYTAEETVTALRQVEVSIASGKAPPKARRESGTTKQTYYRWRKEYGGLKREQARLFQELECENSRLKRLVTELSLEKQILAGCRPGKLVSPAALIRLWASVYVRSSRCARFRCRVR